MGASISKLLFYEEATTVEDQLPSSVDELFEDAYVIQEAPVEPFIKPVTNNFYVPMVAAEKCIEPIKPAVLHTFVWDDIPPACDGFLEAITAWTHHGLDLVLDMNMENYMSSLVVQLEL